MAEVLLLRARHDGSPSFNETMDRSFSLRMPYLIQIRLCASNDRVNALAMALSLIHI